MYNENSYGNSGYGIGDTSVLDLINLTCRVNPVFAQTYKNLNCNISVVYAQNLKNLLCRLSVVYIGNYSNLRCKITTRRLANKNLTCRVKHYHKNWHGWHIKVKHVWISELIDQEIEIEEYVTQEVYIT
jgi:hypothetical protein